MDYIRTNHDSPTGYNGFTAGAKWAESYIASSTERNSDWISVDDALPEDYEVVVICDDSFHCNTAYYLSDAEVWMANTENEDKEFHHVQWWHKLPKLPKK